MTTHFQFSDSEFEEKFQKCLLSPELFNHEAHLRLAWIHITTYGIEKTISNIPSQIKNFVKYVGAVDKYNTTITIAAIKVVYHFMLISESNSFKEFIEEYPRLVTNFRTLFAAHYGLDIFNSKQAKMDFLQPDLLPF